MKRKAKCVFYVGTVVVLVCLSVRVLWHASNTETGATTLRVTWTDATLGWLFGTHVPVHFRDPIHQAQFWLDEVDRIQVSSANSAELAIGAAIVLDRPSPGYRYRYLRFVSTPSTSYQTMDYEPIYAADDSFEVACRAKCVALATRATELEPDNVEWWRLRAMLLWRDKTYTKDAAPRIDDWLDVLETAAEHDRENALYDYLAACFLWQSSSEIETDSDFNERLVVHDEMQFSRGLRHFVSAQSKPYCAVGAVGSRAMLRFLSDTTTPMTCHAAIMEHDPISSRRYSLLSNVKDWQNARAEASADNGDIHEAVAMCHANLRLVDQFTSSDEWQSDNYGANLHRRWSASRLEALVDEHSELFSGLELREVNQLVEDSWVDIGVFRRAAQDLAKKTLPQVPSVDCAAAIRTMLVGLLPSLVVALVTLAITLTGVSRLRDDADLVCCNSKVLGVLSHSLSFMVAFVSVITIFGLSPAEIIPIEVQNWVLSVVVFSVPIVALLWVGWKWLRHRRLRFSLRSMLIGVVVFSLLFGIVANAPLGIDPYAIESLDLFPLGLSIPALGWEQIDAENLVKEFSWGGVPKSQQVWLWAIWQWSAYHGQYLTLALWALFAAVLVRVKLSRFAKQRWSKTVGLLTFLRAWGRSMGQGYLGLTVVIAIIYASFSPAIIEEVDRNFQVAMPNLRRPETQWLEFEAAVSAVRSDEGIMERLRADVKKRIAEASAFEPKASREAEAGPSDVDSTPIESDI